MDKIEAVEREERMKPRLVQAGEIMPFTRTFTMTAEHLILLRHFNICWQNSEIGAPEVDPKRPYGNRAVENDIHELLTSERIGCVGSKRDELTHGECERYIKLHRETETALQIILVTGQFQAGEYRQTDRYDYRTWERKTDQHGRQSLTTAL